MYELTLKHKCIKIYIMIETLKTLLANWKTNANERQKLQHAYIAIAITLVFVAGAASLASPDLGHKLVLIALFVGAAFLANAIVWNLLQSSIVAKLPSKTSRK
jgi:cell division protein FtsW (lipid II flippase)